MELALNVTFVGMFVVFLSLVILYIVIEIIGKLFFAKNSGNGANNKSKNNGSKDTQNTSVNSNTEAMKITVAGQEDDNLIAVITAAIAAYTKPLFESGIIVRSIRRIPQTAPVWNVAGRAEHLAGKQ